VPVLAAVPEPEPEPMPEPVPELVPVPQAVPELVPKLLPVRPRLVSRPGGGRRPYDPSAAISF
jgi:hypothetical protein